MNVNGTREGVEIDNKFIIATDEALKVLQHIRSRMDEYEAANVDVSRQAVYLERIRPKVFKVFDREFRRLWDYFKDIPQEEYVRYQSYFRKKFLPLFRDNVEINERIYNKPLGYPGDYKVMNYIYSHNQGIYLGKNLFEKLINSYTCTIPISNSNIVRKQYFKRKIRNMVRRNKKSRMISLGGGPLRELLELVEAGSIDNKLDFLSIDFEPEAIKYVEQYLLHISDDLKKNLNLTFKDVDVKKLLRQKNDDGPQNDLIYSSGLFDYLKGRFCAALIESFYAKLAPGGEMIICNISEKTSSHRGYYEILGDWFMYYRTKEDMLNWTGTLPDCAKVGFAQPIGNKDTGYLYLKITKDT